MGMHPSRCSGRASAENVNVYKYICCVLAVVVLILSMFVGMRRMLHSLLKMPQTLDGALLLGKEHPYSKLHSMW